MAFGFRKWIGTDEWTAGHLMHSIASSETFDHASVELAQCLCTEWRPSGGKLLWSFAMMLFLNPPFDTVSYNCWKSQLIVYLPIDIWDVPYFCQFTRGYVIRYRVSAMPKPHRVWWQYAVSCGNFCYLNVLFYFCSFDSNIGNPVDQPIKITDPLIFN